MTESLSTMKPGAKVSVALSERAISVEGEAGLKISRTNVGEFFTKWST